MSMFGVPITARQRSILVWGPASMCRTVWEIPA